MSDEELLWGTPESLDERIEELRRDHPGWSQRVFLIYALEQYREIDVARRAGRAGDLTDICTPGCIESLKKEPRTLDIPVNIQGAQICSIREEGEFDLIDVRFIGERKKGTEGPGEVIDYLRFERYRYEHATDSETGVSESCGRCGGAIDPTSDWKCRYCDQRVNEQSSGWMVQKVMSQATYVE
jgi:hypothetical protein